MQAPRAASDQAAKCYRVMAENCVSIHGVSIIPQRLYLLDACTFHSGDYGLLFEIGTLYEPYTSPVKWVF